jgi:hypothetical protein
MLTVENLRKMGYRVKVRHTRKTVMNPDYHYVDFSCRGGLTEVEVYDFATQQAYLGSARCSDNDNFNRKLGVKIALGRALKRMGI